MADISQDLQKILDAIYGEEVRGSIYHAISLINDVSEVILTTGTDITAPTDSSEGYYTGSLYLNLDTYELWKCVGTNAWQSLGILKGATGDNGNKWYRGLAVSGKAVLPTVYPTGIANANANDCYLNPSEGAIYHCVTGGDDTTATWSYDFTMTGGGGGGSIVTWTQIQGATGGVKIAEIDIDGSMQEVYAPEGGGGGMLPYLYIDSEAGATVTVNQPDGTTITPTAAGSGHWECELTGGYGTYVIHSVLSGQGDATLSLAVDTVKEYHVTDTHYDYTINVTAPSGSTVRIVGGGETYTGTGTGSPQAFAVHTPSTAYTVTATQIMDGNTKTDEATVTSAATSGGSTNVTLSIEFGTINVSVAADFVTAGSTITCVNGGTSCTPKTAASTLTFRVPTTGTWTISGEISGQTYSVDVVVSSLSTAVSVNLQTLPEGSTVLPTDDIQIWLNCAGIYDKTSYTKLADVLADSTTLLALMSDNNAVDYLVRSKSWIKNESVPIMTGFTTPSGEVAVLGTSAYPNWHAYDQNVSTHVQVNAGSGQYHLQPNYYKFTTPKKCAIAEIGGYGWESNNAYRILTYKIQASNDGVTWDDLSDVITNDATASGSLKRIPLSPTQSYLYYALTPLTTNSAGVYQIESIQFYTLDGNGITDDSTAMTDIGANNYAADTLLADEDWLNAIVNSTYVENVANAQVPTLTSNTSSPKGVASASSEYTGNEAYQAFNANNSGWSPNSSTGTFWVQFAFTNPVRPLVMEVLNKFNGGVNNCKYEVSNDETNWETVVSSFTMAANMSTFDKYVNYKSTAYKYHRITVTITTNAGAGIKAQFYGREDV